MDFSMSHEFLKSEFFFNLQQQFFLVKRFKFKSKLIRAQSFLRPYKISMTLAAKHRKKSHFDSLVLLVLKLMDIVSQSDRLFAILILNFSYRNPYFLSVRFLKRNYVITKNSGSD
ncbi:hypothetical protein BpHYR1_020325 [Brachionus plicatilis]|uniref:Uncharacterized protein n=1 Tax=Brachionus plicatilis TaxID=10195 RepID=A0A3M7Q7M0_BRAPC|nr:hypothetical protein BpHYR1_020325 [Brachionus plicatilis]